MGCGCFIFSAWQGAAWHCRAVEGRREGVTTNIHANNISFYYDNYTPSLFKISPCVCSRQRLGRIKGLILPVINRIVLDR